MPASTTTSSSSTESRIRAMENTHKLEERIDTLDNKLDTKLEELTRMVLRIEGTLMPRSEIQAEDAKRVSLEMYNSAHQSLIDRLTRLENGPQRLLAWIGVGAGCLGTLISAVGVLAAILIAIIPRLN